MALAQSFHLSTPHRLVLPQAPPSSKFYIEEDTGSYEIELSQQDDILVKFLHQDGQLPPFKMDMFLVQVCRSHVIGSREGGRITDKTCWLKYTDVTGSGVESCVRVMCGAVFKDEICVKIAHWLRPFALSMTYTPCNHCGLRARPLVMDIKRVTSQPQLYHRGMVPATQSSIVHGMVPATQSSIDHGMVPATQSSIRKLGREKFVQECAICLKNFQDGVEVTRMPCSHIFHGDCIVRWLNSSHLCPICRYQMPWSFW